MRFRWTSSSVSGRGTLPSMSVKPYSIASMGATRTVPVCRITSGSAARAVTVRPMNSGDSELLRSSQAAARITFSVLTVPGYSETTLTPCGRSSVAISEVILSVAALETPYATLPMCFCAAQRKCSRSVRSGMRPLIGLLVGLQHSGHVHQQRTSHPSARLAVLKTACSR
jgi:hypothetical protein